jgi:hypothetical protein
MTRIRYIGPKPQKSDNVAGTGTTWAGAGDVQEVPAAAALVLLKFSTVWEDAGTDAKAAAGDEETVDKVAELDALREEASALGIPVIGTWGKPRLTKAIADAKAAAGDQT